MNRTGDRFGPEGAWREAGGVVADALRSDIMAIISAYLRAEPLPHTATVQVPEGLRAPSADHGRIQYAEDSLRVTMERLDPEDGLLDVLGEVEGQGVLDGPLAFMLTLESVREGVYRLWSMPTLVP